MRRQPCNLRWHFRIVAALPTAGSGGAIGRLVATRHQLDSYAGSVTIWWITGARGFLGSNLAVALPDTFATLGVVRPNSGKVHFRQQLDCDLRDTNQLIRNVREVRPSIIFHGAAIAGHETAARDPDQAFDVNVRATEALAAVSSEIGARLVYISTDAIFSGQRGDYTEDDPVEPFSLYGETKLAGEDAVRRELEDHLIVRTNFFGWSETGSKSILEFFVNSLRSNASVNGYVDFVVTSIYVQSLLKTIFQLNDISAIGTFNIVSSNPLSKYEFGKAVAKTFNLNDSLIRASISSSEIHTTSRNRNLSLNTAKVASILGRRMPTQEEGLLAALKEESFLTSLLHYVHDS